MLPSNQESRAEKHPTPDALHRRDGDAPKSGGRRRVLIGSALAGAAGALFGGAPARSHEANGPLSSATISFGAWMLPLDRHPNQSPIAANHHGLCPGTVTVKSGGCVNFIIAGLHQILIYDDGTKPGDIDAGIRIAPAGTGPPFELIADPNGLIYRGIDPTTTPLRERVEVVHFTVPGTYFVMCAIPRHFTDGMYGFIKVLP